MSKMIESFTNRLWYRIDVKGPDECWPWLGDTDTDGYGQITYKNKRYQVPRVVFLVKTGEFPKNFACHTCNHKICCNFDHLYDGTSKENTNDAYEDGLIPTGEACSWSKLTERDVRDLFEKYSHLSHSEAAKILKVSYANIRLIRNGKIWKKVTKPYLEINYK